MYKTIAKLLPISIKTKLIGLVKQQIKENNRIESQAIPRYPVRHETIANTKLLINRKQLLDLMPKGAVVAELGVDQGEFSEKIIEYTAPSKLVLVDLWGSERYNQNKRILVENKFKDSIAEEKVKIEIGYSTTVVDNFENGYFDWIYIDTDHSYATTLCELEKWSAKVKPNGIIAGHDFVVGHWEGMVRYGVMEAVYEFCWKENWEILYITVDHDDYPSFAIRRL